MRRQRGALEKLILTAALAVGAGGCGDFSNFGGIPSSITNSAVRSKEYMSSVGFWIPHGLDSDTVRDQIDAEIRDIVVDAFFGDTFLESIVDLAREGSDSSDARLRFFIKTEDMDGWVQNLTVCNGEEVMVALAYNPGSNQDSNPPHLDGLSFGVYATPLGQTAMPSTEVEDYTLLPRGADSENPPNFLIGKYPRDTSWMMMHEFSSLPDPLPSYLDRIYTIGVPYNAEGNAVLVVDVKCDGEINTQPEPSPEPEINPEDCAPDNLESCISRGACERVGGVWYERDCHRSSETNSEPEPPNPEPESFSNFPAGKYVGTGLERYVITTFLDGTTEDYRDYDGTLLIAFDSDGWPKDYNSSSEEYVRLFQGYTDTQNGLTITVRDISGRGDTVTVSVEADWPTYEMSGTGTETYTFHENDSRGDLYGELEYHFREYNGYFEETTRTTGWGKGPFSE